MGTSKILIDGVGIDLTQDTVAANKMLSGIKAHDSNGDSVTGNIQTWAGQQKSGVKNITANGTYDVSEFSSAVVNVPSDISDALIGIGYNIKSDNIIVGTRNSGLSQTIIEDIGFANSDVLALVYALDPMSKNTACERVFFARYSNYVVVVAGRRYPNILFNGAIDTYDCFLENGKKYRAIIYN